MIRGKEVLPPPTIARTGQQKPALPQRPKPPGPPVPSSAAPPPLPVRKNTDQSKSRPPLPPRKSSDVRRSSDSCFSTASVSTNSTGITDHSSNSSPKYALRAPAFREAELPPLPPKKNKGIKVGGQGTGCQPSGHAITSGRPFASGATSPGARYDTGLGCKRRNLAVFNWKLVTSIPRSRTNARENSLIMGFPVSTPKLPSRFKGRLLQSPNPPVTAVEHPSKRELSSISQRKDTTTATCTCGSQKDQGILIRNIEQL
ncbi:conserved hypothetical protein [Uncinocarpus reesii 1704]|uniref:Uncharacterized protein n=1 Tax=Uncinocarpus reesii (strain UAMH 1704) TaxID=336963 RepID=C4JUX1_UNCRE|nr:uncharacterized protein UREG_04924 [Uncinocarpus reesii 1704]EEP80082.1 conserved hypothetical protein [Uncinocarpus reesii 1704]